MLTEQTLRSVGFNNPDVIRHILSDPQERSKYERELGLVPTTSEGQFNFNYDTELKQAYNDLGSYYERILKEANYDIDTAIARLTEDHDTGKRFQQEGANLSREALQIAQEDLAANADTARRTVEGNLVNRGLLRNSQFTQDPNMGIATETLNRNEENLTRAQDSQNLRGKEFELGQEQQTLRADTALGRGQQDLSTKRSRTTFDLEEERKRRAQELMSSRAQRAYQRFESSLF